MASSNALHDTLDDRSHVPPYHESHVGHGVGVLYTIGFQKVPSRSSIVQRGYAALTNPVDLEAIHELLCWE